MGCGSSATKVVDTAIEPGSKENEVKTSPPPTAWEPFSSPVPGSGTVEDGAGGDIEITASSKTSAPGKKGILSGWSPFGRSKTTKAKAKAKPKKNGVEAMFVVGDRVKVVGDDMLSDSTERIKIPKGTRGTIIEIDEVSDICVRFHLVDLPEGQWIFVENAGNLTKEDKDADLEPGIGGERRSLKGERASGKKACSKFTIVQGLYEAAIAAADSNPLAAAGLASSAAEVAHSMCGDATQETKLGLTPSPDVAIGLAMMAVAAAESKSETAYGLVIAAAESSLIVATSRNR